MGTQTPMDDDQIGHFIAAMERTCAYFNVPPQQHSGGDAIRDDYAGVAHVRWMLQELRRPGMREDTAKANRWIGCILGIMMGIGQITPDQARHAVYGALTLA